MDKSRKDLLFINSLKKNSGESSRLLLQRSGVRAPLNLGKKKIMCYRLLPDSELLLCCTDTRTTVTEYLLCKVSLWALRTFISHPQRLPPIRGLLTLCTTMSWNCFHVQLSLWLFPLCKWKSNISEIDKTVGMCSLKRYILDGEPSSCFDFYLRCNSRE